ncbi:CCL19 protein, partial [Atractosteus spatula]|nr:CCL19 protein [Atractosteus spatula]
MEYWLEAKEAGVLSKNETLCQVFIQAIRRVHLHDFATLSQTSRSMSTMSLKAITLLLLASILWSSSEVAYGDMNIAVDCCLDVSNAKIPIKIVKTYQKQSNSNGCKIEAMVFITKRNVKLCAPHNEAWVKELIEKVEKRNKGCKGFNFKVTVLLTATLRNHTKHNTKSPVKAVKTLVRLKRSEQYCLFIQ